MQPGDLVRIEPHTLHPVFRGLLGWWDPCPSPDAGKEAWVLSLEPLNTSDLTHFGLWSGSGSGKAASLRLCDLVEGGCHRLVRVPVQFLTLVQEGNGVVEPGVTYPFSPAELKEQRWVAWEARCMAADRTHQGWSNAATFLAHLYLTQECRLVDAVDRIRRRDGSLHPGKLARLAAQGGVVVDEWALQPPIDVPDEFRDYPKAKHKNHVHWAEVALELHREWLERKDLHI